MRFYLSPQAQKEEMHLIIHAEICSEPGRVVCIKHLPIHTLLKMVLEIELKCQGQVFRGV